MTAIRRSYTENRASRTPLSRGEYEALQRGLQQWKPKRNYSETTQLKMSLLAEKWKGYVKLSNLMGPLLTGTRYCKQMNLNDHDALATSTKENFMVFFKWLCDTSKIQKKTTLLGYKRVFKIMYEKLVGIALNIEIYKALHLWIDHDLSKLYNLNLKRREKPILYFDNVFRLLNPLGKKSEP
ncbi:hypothetical protein QBC40DRAFT_320261 [Triangularia verruculosa]|uniref:Uncharacterized protein n=1 Tax=Triangularia verruculosa TaxID=2587418 RepID=A0AAN6XR94_9PEZI|nr:hypothetical protein QBC40DRAFT_320261 [Triangularia verruculosa]